MIINAQTKNSIWNLNACEKETACSLIKNGNMGSFGFGYRAGPCFLAVKSFKNPLFLARNKNPRMTINSLRENHYFPVQISLNHA